MLGWVPKGKSCYENVISSKCFHDRTERLCIRNGSNLRNEYSLVCVQIRIAQHHISDSENMDHCITVIVWYLAIVIAGLSFRNITFRMEDLPIPGRAKTAGHSRRNMNVQEQGCTVLDAV